MSRFNAQIVSIAAEREAQRVKKAFLQLVQADLTDRPDDIKPIPASLVSRTERLRAKANANRENGHLLEG